MFNREAYEAFKLNPEVCLLVSPSAKFGERREARERLIQAGQMDMMRLSHVNTKSSPTIYYDVVDDSRSSINPDYSTITIVMFSLALEFNEFPFVLFLWYKYCNDESCRITLTMFTH